MTIRRRLNLYYVGTILGLATFMVVVIVLALVGTVRTSVEQTARATALQIARDLDGGAVPDAALLEAVNDDNVLVVIRDGAGAVLVESSAEIYGIAAEERRLGGDVWRDSLAAGTAVTSVVNETYIYALPITPAASSARVLEAWLSYDARGEASLPLGTLIVYILVALLVAGLLGGFLHVRGVLKPIAALARSAESISASDLTRRLPDRGTRDELDRLAGSFNGVLGRLEASFAEREEVLARQRRFTSDASHELRTPLASILGYARMLRSWGLTDPATATEGVAMIEREATRLVAMTEHLLALARVDESGPTVRRAPCDLRNLAASEVATMRAASGDGPTISLSVPDEPVMVEVDVAEVRRAICAVLENAVRFTSVAGDVRVSVGRLDGWATIVVADSGPGIPLEHQPHIFDRFYQADPSRSTSGSGLGLAIARQAVERQGGRIELSSPEGQGATFTVWLPTSPSSSLPPPSSPT